MVKKATPAEAAPVANAEPAEDFALSGAPEPPEAPGEPAEGKPKRRRMVLDKEIQAMNDICETLDELGEDAAERVMAWLNRRFGPRLTSGELRAVT